MLALLNVLGWVGGLMVAGAYMAVTTGRVTSDSKVFQLANTIGALLLGAACIAQSTWQPAALNVLWFAFGARALLNARASSQRQRTRLGTGKHTAAAFALVSEGADCPALIPVDTCECRPAVVLVS